MTWNTARKMTQRTVPCVNARENAMSLLLYKPRSEAELRERLCGAGFSTEEAENAVDYVKSFGYVNDRRYAENYARSMQERASRRMIRMGLRQKGVEEDLIVEALEDLDVSEEETLERMIRKKAGVPHHLEEKEMRRLYGFLARKGFSGGAVSKAVRRYEGLAED